MHGEQQLSVSVKSLWFKGKEFTCSSSVATVEPGALVMNIVKGMFELLS